MLSDDGISSIETGLSKSRPEPRRCHDHSNLQPHITLSRHLFPESQNWLVFQYWEQARIFAYEGSLSADFPHVTKPQPCTMSLFLVAFDDFKDRTVYTHVRYSPRLSWSNVPPN